MVHIFNQCPPHPRVRPSSRFAETTSKQNALGLALSQHVYTCLVCGEYVLMCKHLSRPHIYYLQFLGDDTNLWRWVPYTRVGTYLYPVCNRANCLVKKRKRKSIPNVDVTYSKPKIKSSCLFSEEEQTKYSMLQKWLPYVPLPSNQQCVVRPPNCSKPMSSHQGRNQEWNIRRAILV
jgi:hypothetical protein